MAEESSYRPLPLPDRVALGPAASLANVRQFRDYMAKRHSVRDFAPTPVDEAVIATCISSAGGAPSGANRQPWHFVAISDPAVKVRIRAAAEAEEQAFYAGGGGMRGCGRWSRSEPARRSRTSRSRPG